jgi:hypothetical protein
MGQSTKSASIENPQIIVRQVSQNANTTKEFETYVEFGGWMTSVDFYEITSFSRYEASFEGSPTEGRFAGETPEEAVQNMVEWYSTMARKLREEAERSVALAAKFDDAVATMKRLRCQT